MPETLEALRKTVLAGVREQRKRRAEPALRRSRAKTTTHVLATFIEVCLERMEMGDSQFAAALDVEPELAEALLDAALPASEIDDALLVDIARVIQHDPNLLRLMMGRQPVFHDSPSQNGSRANSAGL